MQILLLLNKKSVFKEYYKASKSYFSKLFSVDLKLSHVTLVIGNYVILEEQFIIILILTKDMTYRFIQEEIPSKLKKLKEQVFIIHI